MLLAVLVVERYIFLEAVCNGLVVNNYIGILRESVYS